MKKEDYIKQMNDIYRRERDLRYEKQTLKNKYIKESDIYQQFKVGEKVIFYRFQIPIKSDWHKKTKI